MAITNFLKSKFFFFLAVFLILGSAHFFYPKWQNTGSEASISWDVFGYYLYLPAFFIYDDWQELNFVEDISQKYHPAGENSPITKLENGNATGQYSLGWPIFHLPAFVLGHIAAKISKYPVDGFSKPYQMAISFYGLAFAYLGLILTFYNLRNYFSLKTSALSILLLLLGTNALNYFAIDSAHTHGPIFFLYALLIYLSISWHKNPTLFKSIGIGFVYGLMCTIRPTEIIAILIPVFWGLGSWEGLKTRIALFRMNSFGILLSLLAFLITPVIQMTYWKIVTGHFIFYSYVGQTFSWLHPHIIDVLLSYRKGWLIYTPIALLFIIGLPFLYKKSPKLFYVVFLFFLVNLYIISSWDIWWYGGSLGQRALVQSYALLVFPLAAFLHEASQKTWSKIFLGIFCFFSILHNLSFHYKAYSTAPFEAEAMTAAFFKRSYFEFAPNPEFYKLLDTDFIFEGAIGEHNSIQFSKEKLTLSASDTKSNFKRLPLTDTKDYFRLKFSAQSQKIQSYFWNMPQVNITQLDPYGKVLQSDFLRVHRFLLPSIEKQLYFDVKLNSKATSLEISLSNPNGAEALVISIQEGLTFNAK